jgi:hypothetical protein
MPFVDEILRLASVAIVGLAKNAGKTTVLNYVLHRVGAMPFDEVSRVAVTSIGLDGEAVDLVTHTSKPAIELPAGIVFVTSETHYRQKRLVAEVLDVGRRETALGKLVTARALTAGGIVLSGPPDTASLARLIDDAGRFGVRTMLVDGALSRRSHASPAVTAGMVLVTGAAVAASVDEVVGRTKFVCDLAQLPAVTEPLPDGVTWVPGMLGEQMLDRLRPCAASTHLVVGDFTRVFATSPTFYSFVARGGRVSVLRRTPVVAVCVNPVSPAGWRFDGDELVARLAGTLGLPVYDVLNLAHDRLSSRQSPGGDERYVV